VAVKISGTFPKLLYRGFDQEEYAYSFLKEGSFLMRTLSYYKNTEDPKRRDEDEGKGRYDYWMEDRPAIWTDKESGQILSQGINPGPVDFHTQSLNPCYILCFYGPEVRLDYIASRNRPYVVRINDPGKLVRHIASYLNGCSNLSDEMWLICVKVRYDKNQYVNRLPEPASEERLAMSYGQKHPTDASDNEYRLVLTLPVTTENLHTEIEVKLGRLEKAELIKL